VDNNKKNRDYFVIKGGISLTTTFLNHELHNIYSNKELFRSCCSVLGNMAESNDHKILLQVVGSISHILYFIDECMNISTMTV
jgi:hypothetical protein